MAIKKSELYSKLWQSCDELRGGMDASNYKDYVLVLLFIKYVSDKYAGKPFAQFAVPDGASFKDMVALKGKADIGDQINKKIVEPLASANKLTGMPDFNDPTKLGDGKEMVDRLTNLIAIFEDKALDFASQRAGDDDILGDAYEYLMRHFATESGKSKGQFYTPAEVSRVMAQIIGIADAETSAKTTVYDPTCGSGSLLLKVADAAKADVTLYGQEKDSVTAGLARMNMILHENATAEILAGNTLSSPKWTSGNALKQFDYVVANPPFSDKKWSTGLDPENDPYERFSTFGIPPGKQGDYAYLLHIVRSLKSTGHGACILPHGVLFRGNAEAGIRKALIEHGYIAGIIGLPANLFYGTGIPACIIVINKSGAAARKGLFMIDASKGFAKDGPKNRLRARDIHRITDVFKSQRDVPGYARFVSNDEIIAEDYNLNIPRYIDSRDTEDIQDLEGHMRGGIPERDVEALSDYWAVCPNLKASLFSPDRPGYLSLIPERANIRAAINEHPEFQAFTASLSAHFDIWREEAAARLKALDQGCKPKEQIHALSESLLAHYEGQPLISPYAVYQHLMDYWDDVMQDDLYLVSETGWLAETRRVIEEKKNKDGKVTKTVDKGWKCDLVPKPLIVARYFATEQSALNALQAESDTVDAEITELEEEHRGDEAAFGDLDKINKKAVASKLRDSTDEEEIAILQKWMELSEHKANLTKEIKGADVALDQAAYDHYPNLSATDVKALVVDGKWLAFLTESLRSEVEQGAGALTRRVQDLADRYADPLPGLTRAAVAMETKLEEHLTAMGLKW